MNTTRKSTHETLREVREHSSALRGYFADQTKRLKFIAGLESVAVEPRHQLDQLRMIHDEALDYFDEFLELTESIPQSKRNRHILPHIRGEVRNIQKNMEKFVEQLKATHDTLIGQLNSPARTSTGEFETIFDFIIGCMEVAKDKLRNTRRISNTIASSKLNKMRASCV